MSYRYEISSDVRQFLTLLKTHRDNSLYQDVLNYPSLLEELYYAELTRDYALSDWNNNLENIDLKNSFRNASEKYKELTIKKNIVFDKLLKLMTTMEL